MPDEQLQQLPLDDEEVIEDEQTEEGEDTEESSDKPLINYDLIAEKTASLIKGEKELTVEDLLLRSESEADESHSADSKEEEFWNPYDETLIQKKIKEAAAAAMKEFAEQQRREQEALIESANRASESFVNAAKIYYKGEPTKFQKAAMGEIWKSLTNEQKVAIASNKNSMIGFLEVVDGQAAKLELEELRREGSGAVLPASKRNGKPVNGLPKEFTAEYELAKAIAPDITVEEFLRERRGNR